MARKSKKALLRQIKNKINKTYKIKLIEYTLLELEEELEEKGKKWLD